MTVLDLVWDYNIRFTKELKEELGDDISQSIGKYTKCEINGCMVVVEALDAMLIEKWDAMTILN